MKFHVQEPEENVFDGLKVNKYALHAFASLLPDLSLQDRGHVWQGSKEDENVFEDAAGTYVPDDPSTEEVKFKAQPPEENVFEDVKVGYHPASVRHGSEFCQIFRDNLCRKRVLGCTETAHVGLRPIPPRAGG